LRFARTRYDLLIQSEAGFLSVTGTPAEPAKAGCSIADIAAGMYAYTSILAALLQRQRTGLGSHIEVSMLEALTEWMSYPLYYAFDGASAPETPPSSAARYCTGLADSMSAGAVVRADDIDGAGPAAIADAATAPTRSFSTRDLSSRDSSSSSGGT